MLRRDPREYSLSSGWCSSKNADNKCPGGIHQRQRPPDWNLIVSKNAALTPGPEASDWSRVVTWPEYWPLIGRECSHAQNTGLWLVHSWPGCRGHYPISSLRILKSGIAGSINAGKTRRHFILNLTINLTLQYCWNIYIYIYRKVQEGRH